MNLVSDTVFHWFLQLLTGLMAGGWLIYDAINLVRTRKADRADPVVRDKHFGYVMGMIIGVIGLVGVLRFQGVL
jgi:hypothetical protein